MRKPKAIRLLTVLLSVSTSSLFAEAAFASTARCEAEILRAAERHKVPVGVLYAVGLTETGREGSLYAWALNIEGHAVYPRSAQEAVRVFESSRREGKKLIDLGCMQINYYYHSSQFSGVRQMLEPARNVDYAARFLAELKKRHGTWAMAVARYHAGPDNDPAQQRYICRVITNLVTTGFGNWTPEARKFCNS